MNFHLNKIKFGLTVVSIFFALIGPVVTYAQNTTTYTLLAPLPCIPGNGVACNGKETGPVMIEETVNVQQYIQYAFNLFIALAAVTAVLVIVYGGFMYMTSDAYSQKSDGIEKITNALKGLVLILCSYLILRTINPQFVSIPVGLVTPLGLHGEGNGLGYDWESILSDARKNNAAAQAAVDNAKQTKVSIDQLEQQRTELCRQLATQVSSGVIGNNSGPYKDACAAMIAKSQGISGTNGLILQISGIDNQVVKMKADVILDLAKSKIDNGGVARGLDEINKLHLNNDASISDINAVVKAKSDLISETARKDGKRLKALGAFEQQAILKEKEIEANLTLSIDAIDVKTNLSDIDGVYIMSVAYLSGYGFTTLSGYKASLNKELDFMSDQLITVENVEQRGILQKKITVVRDRVARTKLK